jgi:hypothetical protein
MFKDRLELLAEKHEYDHVVQERFEYTRWVGEDWEGKPDLSCGTLACSMGWATTIPVFQELGLRLKMWNDGWNRSYGIVSLTNEQGTFDAEIAAAKLFDITTEQAQALFVYGKWVSEGVSHDHPTAKDMAQAIRNFIQYDGNYAEFYQTELGR